MKKTIYLNFDEESQMIFGLLPSYGARPTLEHPTPNDETGDRIKEDALKDPDDRDEKENYQPGVEYGLDEGSDGLSPRSVFKNPKTEKIDTIRNPSNGPRYTIPGR